MIDEQIRQLLRQLAQAGPAPLDPDVARWAARLEQLAQALERNNNQLKRALKDLHRNGQGLSRKELRVLQQLLAVESRDAAAIRQAIRPERLRRFFDPKIRRLAVLLRLIGLPLPPWLAVLLVVVSVALVAGVVYYYAQRASPQRQIAGVVSCDCASIGDWGILTEAVRSICREREQELLGLASRNKLNLKLDERGRILSGEICDEGAQGERAWPAVGRSCPREVPHCG